DPAVALELAEADVRTRRDVQGVDLLAWARYLNGDLDGAVAAEREARRLGTVDATMLFHAGMIDLATGDRDGGRDLLRQALGPNPCVAPGAARPPPRGPRRRPPPFRSGGAADAVRWKGRLQNGLQELLRGVVAVGAEVLADAGEEGLVVGQLAGQVAVLLA